MASTIKIKNSSTAGAIPTSSDLVQGELAVNVTDKTIFTENASGTVVELGKNYTGFKNRIINGAMMIDQRNAGASVTPANAAYTLDRWQATAVPASGKFSVIQSTIAPSGYVNSMLATSLSAFSISSTDIHSLRQKIEGLNFADMAWGTASAQSVTISFWVRSSLTGTFGGVLQNSASDRSYPFTYVISSANTWEQKTITVAGDTSGTWLTTNGIGATLTFGLGVGSTYSGTAGSWASANYYSATGATSLVGTNGATWYITGVQLEKGSTATSFDYRPYGTELALCQRYYEKGNAGNLAVCSNGVFWGIPIAFKVSKRAIPTMSGAQLSSNIGNTGETAIYTSSEFYIYGVVANSSGVGNVAITYTASAEL